MKTAGGPVSPYDQVLYPAAVFPQTHPIRLATVAFLRGMQPAAINRCRVLELACGVGSNVTGMAFQLPESEFIGLDLARRPIASGQAFVAELGLRNIRLHSLDLCEASAEEFGKFDFIVAHGVYSWVPRPVRERILAICREMLNPQGVAYISYNAYPGNHLRDLVRGMMRFHTACFDDPAEKVGQARGLLKFLAESTPKPGYYVDSIRAQFERTVKHRDEAFFHDDLSEVNRSFYFYEFIGDAERHDLQFVGEASANELHPEKFTPEVMQKMNELKGAKEVVREQYKDFIRGSAFRQTLLCHKEIELAPDLLMERIPKLYVSCDAAPKESSESGEATRFLRPGGDELQTTNPLICAALKSLWSYWPAATPFEGLLAIARAAVSSHTTAICESDDRATLAEALARAYRAGFLQMHIFPPEVASRPSDRPAVSRLARFQLDRGEFATSQLHVLMGFPDPLSELTEYVRSGRGKLFENGVLVESMVEVAAILERRVREGLESLAREGMLVS
jgi:SAM-dependent methyltransferase